MGTTTFTGPVVSNNGFTGNVTGNVTGDVTGEVTGAVDATTITASGEVTLDGTTITITGLPTSDPAVAGQLWDSAGTLSVSQG